MIISTIIVIRSRNWLNIWIGLEINLISFIPLIYKSKNNYLSQGIIIYFLIQRIASTIFIIIILINRYLFINIINQSVIRLAIIISIIMKIGIPPFHIWFPELISKLRWRICIILITWQKIAPIYILSQRIENNKIIISLIIISNITGAILGLNHTSTRKIIAYSSINHIGWLVACTIIYKKLWIIYIFIYIIIIVIICVNIQKYNIIYINQFNIKSSKIIEKISFIIIILRIGGLPPFLGFLPKWITIEYIIISNEIFILTMIVLSSLITLSYYLKIIRSINIIIRHSQKWINFNKTKKISTTLTLNINIILPISILLINFI